LGAKKQLANLVFSVMCIVLKILNIKNLISIDPCSWSCENKKKSVVLVIDLTVKPVRNFC